MIIYKLKMSDLVEIISRCINENDTSKITKVISDLSYVSDLRSCCWDLIPILFKNVSKIMVKENNDLKICCQDLLKIVAEKVEPEEVVLEFLDHMDGADSVKFCFILKLLSISLLRCTQNKQRIIESSLVSIRSYLEELVASDADYITEEEYEEELCDQMPEIVTVLGSVIDFYSHFSSLILNKIPSNETGEMVKLFSSRLLQVYDIFMPFDNDTNSPLSFVEQKMKILIVEFIKNPFYLLTFLSSRSLRQQINTSGKKKLNVENINLRNVCDDFEIKNSIDNLSVFETDMVISNSGYASFFYSLLCIQNERLLKLVSGTKLDRLDLYFQFHEKILIHLNNVMVYSQMEDARKIALLCFKEYIEAFDYEARYLLILHYRPKIEHSGTLGFVITLIKNYILNALEKEKIDSHCKYYRGKFLYDLIAQYCFLTQGDKTDLVENADQVISSLNLLRFLFLRDKENKTGIKNYVKQIHTSFLQPLECGVATSKEFYKTKLMECGKEESLSADKIELTVNGKSFATLPEEDQKNALYASLNAIDLIDSLLLRVFECYTDDVS